MSEGINQEIYLLEHNDLCMMDTMQDETISEFKELYLKTANEYLTILGQNLRELEKNNSEELFQRLFMASHSLKSQSLAMNYIQIGRIARTLEILFQLRTNPTKSISPDNISSIQSLLEFIKISLVSIEKTGEEKSLSENEYTNLAKIQKG